MRHSFAVAASILVVLAGSPARAQTSPLSDRGGWPDTRAGEIARHWVRAFASGEAAMKEFNEKERAPQADEQGGPNKRIEKYRELRERWGKLELASVVKSAPYELTAKLMDSNASQHEFTFKVQPAPPYKLVSISIRQPGHDLGGLFGGFHH